MSSYKRFLVAVLFVLFPLALASKDDHRHFEQIAKLQTFFEGPPKKTGFEGFPQVYWIDAKERCMYRYAAASDPAALAWPANILFPSPHLHEYKRGSVKRFECTTRLQDFSIDTDRDHTIVALDVTNNRVLKLSPQKHHDQWAVFVGLASSSSPTALLFRHKVLYVFDASARTVQVFRHGSMGQTLTIESPLSRSSIGWSP